MIVESGGDARINDWARGGEKMSFRRGGVYVERTAAAVQPEGRR